MSDVRFNGKKNKRRKLVKKETLSSGAEGLANDTKTRKCDSKKEPPSLQQTPLFRTLQQIGYNDKPLLCH